MTKEASLEAVNSVLSKEVRKLQEELKAADKTNMALTARVAELEAIANQLEAEALDYAIQNEELRDAGQEVLHLSDRKHAAWDRLRAENERLRTALQEVKPLVLGANHSEARHPKALAVLCQDEDGCVSNSPEKPDGSRVVHELISQDWDRGPYNVVAELKSLLTSVVDHGASIDSGTTAAAAYLYAQIGGVEYRITVVENRRINETGSNNG